MMYGIEKEKVDLTKFFDRADLWMNIEDWDAFERGFYNEIYTFDRGFDGVMGIIRVP